MPVHVPRHWPPDPYVGHAQLPRDIPAGATPEGPDAGPRSRSIAAVRRAEDWAIAAEQNIVSLVGTSVYAPEAGHIAQAWAAIGLAWDAIGRG